MLKRNLPPSHPGEILREMFIKELNLSITEVAEGLGVARGNLSAIVNERAGISPELSVKLSQAFGNTAQFWINLQKNYELWHAERYVDRKYIRRFFLEKHDTVHEGRGSYNEEKDVESGRPGYETVPQAQNETSFVIERRENGDWSIRKPGAKKSSAVAETQHEAIQRARHMNPNARIQIERVSSSKTQTNIHKGVKRSSKRP